VDDEIDRKAYCRRVGISESTLYRWVGERVVVPAHYVGPRHRQVFTEEDVRFGSALKCALDKHRGEYSLKQMVEVVRGERELAKFSHSPPGAPPAPGQSD
jgi:hypothetical protein